MVFQVQLTDRPVEFTLQDDESILAGGLRHGLTLPYGCQSGGCGSCRVRLREGQISYPQEPAALSAAERESGYILMCLARARSDLALELHQPLEMDALKPRSLPARLIDKRMLADDVVGLRLQTPPANPLRYMAGQYLDFLLDDGRRRSFSIANAPNDQGIVELHLRHVAGGRFVDWVINEMPERAMFRIEGPLGAFYLRDDSRRPMLLMAGGTGFAPVRAMIQHYMNLRLDRPLHLYWGARQAADLYALAEIRAWVQDHAQLQFTPVLSEADANWQGARGWVHEALLADYPQLQAHEVYMSGPPPMIQAAKPAFAAAGLDADHLYYDSFDYAFETWPALG